MENYSNLSSAGQSSIPIPGATTSWTEMPNWILDEAAPTLDGAPLKVLLYIARRTRGFHRESDAISLDQFTGGIVTHDGRQLDRGCGVRSRTTVLKALAELERCGYIGRAHGRPGRGKDATTLYFLRGSATNAARRGTLSEPHQEIEGNDGVQLAHPTGVQLAHPQKKVVLKQSSYDNDTTAHTRETSTNHETAEPSVVQLDSPLLPAPIGGTDNISAGQLPATGTAPPPDDADAQAIDLAVGALSVELGDETPRASQARAHGLRRDTALSAPAFLALLGEAATRTRVYKPGIAGRQRDGRHKAMHYLFAVLRDLIDHERLPLSPVSTDAVARLPRSATGAAPTAMAATMDAITEVDPTWHAVLQELRADVTPENYTQWFRPTRVVSHDEKRKELFIGVPDAFHQRWLDQRLRGCIERALKRVASGVHLAFVVVDTAAPAPDSLALSSAGAGGVDDHDGPK